MDWNKIWSKKYPIIKNYKKQIKVEKYEIKLKEMLDELEKEYNFSNQDAMLVLKDMLYQIYLENKKS